MKEFVPPEIKVVEFIVEDIVTVSTDEDEGSIIP